MNRLLTLLTSVSDGRDVDWEKEEAASGTEADRRLVRSLRLVARMAERRALEGSTGKASPGLEPGRYGPFELLEPIGGGSYGWVWRARDLRLGRLVAIKVFDEEAESPEEAESLEEARRLATLRHPNVVTIHGIETLAGRPAIVMELIEGRTLDRVLEDGGRFGAAEILAVGSDGCRALAAVHGAGLLHRDVKAQNVMREEGGRIVLMDFGPRGGTPRYMAPELFRADPASVATDLYALGVLLYHLATGSFPLEAGTVDELKKAHESGARRPLLDLRPDLSPRLAAVIERAFDPEPSRRWASAGEMERALRAAGESEAAAAEAASRVPGAGWGRPRRLLPVMAALVAVAALAIVWIAFERRPSPLSTETLADPRDRFVVESPAVGAPPAVESPAAPVPLGPAALPAGRYTVEATFYRGRGQRVRLDSGDRVAPGDSVSLRVQASQALYLYVVNEDDAGDAFLLFPAAGLDPGNPLSAGASAVLPGKRGEEPFYWQVTSAGGTEHLLVIASPRPLPELERELAALDRPEPGAPVRFVQLPPASLETLRGLGGLVQGRADAAGDPGASTAGGPQAARRLYELAEPLAAGPDTASGVWIRRLELENPGAH